MCNIRHDYTFSLNSENTLLALFAVTVSPALENTLSLGSAKHNKVVPCHHGNVWVFTHRAANTGGTPGQLSQAPGQQRAHKGPVTFK